MGVENKDEQKPGQEPGDANQDTSGQQAGGQTPTMEQLQGQVKDLQGKVTTAEMKAKNAEDLLGVFSPAGAPASGAEGGQGDKGSQGQQQPGGQTGQPAAQAAKTDYGIGTPQVPNFGDPVQNPEDFNRNVANYMNQTIQAGVASAIQGFQVQSTQAQEVRRVFYDKNPDLKDYPDIVAAVTTHVTTTQSNLRPDQTMDKIAERTREIVGKSAAAGNAGKDNIPAHSGVTSTSRGQEDKNKGSEGDKAVPTQDEILKDEMKRRRKIT